MTAALGPLGAHADEHAPPPSLIERALQRSGDNDGRERGGSLSYARLIPQLSLRGVVQQAQGPGHASVQNLAMIELAWPLDRLPGEAVAATRDVRQRAAARESLVDHIMEAWHQREQALDHADDLAADEADAELDALTGEIDP